MITKRLQHTQFKCVRNGKGSDMCNAQYSVSVFKNAATDTGKAVTSKPSSIVVLRNLPGNSSAIRMRRKQVCAHLTSAADRLGH